MKLTIHTASYIADAAIGSIVGFAAGFVVTYIIDSYLLDRFAR